jgi:mono/diheme cytochrome c family protein
MLLILIANAPVYSNTVLAQDGGNPTISHDSRSGEQQFRQYCASCHGNDGTGDGPVASELKRKPANLTVLSKNNNGVFPTSEVHDFIVGTRQIPSHGTREMPVWGYAFMFRPGAMAGPFVPVLTPQQVEAKVNLLVDYVESIQQK